MKAFTLFLFTLMGLAWAQDTAAPASTPAGTDTSYNYQSLYENGFYEEAAGVLDSIIRLEPDSIGEEPLKILAFCNIMLNRQPGAMVLFKKILSRNPVFTLDPILTPPRFYEVFHQARSEWLESPEGKEILLKKKALEDSLQTERLKKLIPRERWPAYARVPVCLLPGGAGQFYYRKILKGSLFLAVEAAALGACIWSFNRREDFKDPQYGWTPANQASNDRYVNYMRIQFSVFTLAYLAGVADAFFLSPDKEQRK